MRHTTNVEAFIKSFLACRYDVCRLVDGRRYSCSWFRENEIHSRIAKFEFIQPRKWLPAPPLPNENRRKLRHHETVVVKPSFTDCGQNIDTSLVGARSFKGNFSNRYEKEAVGSNKVYAAFYLCPGRTIFRPDY